MIFGRIPLKFTTIFAKKSFSDIFWVQNLNKEEEKNEEKILTYNGSVFSMAKKSLKPMRMTTINEWQNKRIISLKSGTKTVE